MAYKHPKILHLSILLLILSIAVGCREQAQQKAAYRTAAVEKGELEITVSAPGRVEPEAAVEIKSKASGQVIELPFKEGDSVKKGDLLARLDPETEQRLLQKARAKKSTAEAALQKARILYDSAKADFARIEGLIETRAVSRAQIEEAERNVEVQKQEMKICEANLAAADEEMRDALARLEETEIRAPGDGIIIRRLVEPGQIISSGLSSLDAGTTLMIMANLDSLLVRSEVNEADISGVKPEQEARIELDAFQDAVFEGKVIRISPQGHLSSGITVFDVIIEVTDSRRSHLKPMMSARVEVVTERIQDSLLVPLEAVRREKGETGVWVLNKKPQWRKVETGPAGWEKIVITQGLAEGETVILDIMENYNQPR